MECEARIYGVLRGGTINKGVATFHTPAPISVKVSEIQNQPEFRILKNGEWEKLETR